MTTTEKLKRIRAELISGLKEPYTPIPHKDVRELFYVCRAIKVLDEVIAEFEVT